MASVRSALSLKDWVQWEVWVKDRHLLLQKLDELGIYKVHHLTQFPLIYCQLKCLGLESHHERALMLSIWGLEKSSIGSCESSRNQQTIKEWITSEVQVSRPDECVQRFRDLGIEQTAQLVGFPHIHDLVTSLKSLKLFERLRLTHAMQILRRGGALSPTYNTAGIHINGDASTSLQGGKVLPSIPADRNSNSLQTSKQSSPADKERDEAKYTEDVPVHVVESSDEEENQETFVVVSSEELETGQKNIEFGENSQNGLKENSVVSAERFGTSEDDKEPPIKRRRGRPRKGESVHSPGAPENETKEERRLRKDRDGHKEKYNLDQGKMTDEQRERQREKWRLGKQRERARKSGNVQKEEMQKNGNHAVQADSSTPSVGRSGTSDIGLVDNNRDRCENVDQLNHINPDPEVDSFPSRQDVGQVDDYNNPIASTSNSLGPGTSGIAPNSLNMFDLTGTLPTPISGMSPNNLNYSKFSPRVGAIDDHMQPGSVSIHTQSPGYDVLQALNSHNLSHAGTSFQSFMPFSPVQVDNVLSGVHDQGGSESRTVTELRAQSQHDQNDNSLIDVVSVQETRHKPPGTTDILSLVKIVWEVEVQLDVYGFDITQTGEIIYCTHRGVRMRSAVGKRARVPFDKSDIKCPRRVAVNQQTGDVIITRYNSRDWFVYIKDGAEWRKKVYSRAEEWGPVSWTPTGQVVGVLYKDGKRHIVKYNKEDGQQVWPCPTECDYIPDIAVDSRGYIYCCDIDGECVRVYNTEGSLSHTVPRDPDTVHALLMPVSICVDSRDRLLVLHQEKAEYGEPRVVTLWSSDGTYITKLLDNVGNENFSRIRLHNDQTLVMSSGFKLKSYNISSAFQAV